MSNYNSADDASKGSPNLEFMQYLQDNWGRAQISASIQVDKISVTASGTSGVTSTNIPVGSEIMAALNHAKATSGSGTARLSVGDGGANITNAMVMAVEDAATFATSIDQTYKVVTSDGVTVTTNSDTDLGDIYVFYKK